MFLTKEVNDSGIYVVQFLINGQYQQIAIDDYFPVDPDTKLPAFSHSGKNLIWPLIIEKAWAKLNGSFENIMTGHSHDVLSFLIPGPSVYINMRAGQHDHPSVQKMIHDGIKLQHIMCTSTYTVKDCPDIKAKGLVPNHSYSIIDSIQITNDKKQKIYLLRLKNPWGSKEWRGPWSRKDKAWTKSCKEQISHIHKIPGAFYIPFTEFTKYFKILTITK